jgi:CheY-like chemotaxis protein
MKIRAFEHSGGRRRTPVHALTANAMKGDAETCAAAGMDGHLAKPLERERLRQLLLSIGGSIARDEPPASNAPAPRGAAVDLEKALERCGGDAELLADVAVAFEESFAENGAALRAAVLARDGDAIHRAAHSLKGVFVYVCADTAAKLAQELCVAGRQGELAGVPALVEALMRECDEVRRVLGGVRPVAAAPAA